MSDPSRLSLAGKTALVSGGGRGIGRAVCVLFGRLGARVAVNYRADEAAARETVAALAADGAQAVAMRADLALPAEADRLVAEAESALGPLEIVVANHGIWKKAPLETMTPEQWEETIRTNLGGSYALVRAAARRMIPRGKGSIVVIASTAGQRGEPEYSHYAASKGGLIAFTKSLAAELSPRGIRVNAVSPGWVETDMTREALEAPGAAADLRKIPLGRAGRPEEIAGPVAFLASDLASYVYGEVLAVNGGAVMAV
jgi:3-oxoacyl-[acyl-carrier protein] reductase